MGYLYLTTHLKFFLDQDLQNNLKRELVLSKGFIEEQIQGAKALENPYALAQRIGSEIGNKVLQFLLTILYNQYFVFYF